MTRRDAIRILPAAVLAQDALAAKGKSGKPIYYSPYNVGGFIWKLVWIKAGRWMIGSVVGPDGRIYLPQDPRVPITIIQPTDAIMDEPEVFPVNPLLQSPPRRAEAAGFLFVLDVYSQDRVIVVEQKTGLYRTEVIVPTRPQGIGINRDGSRVFVTHLEVEQGNPFFPAALPRVSVINTSNFSLGQPINLPTGKVPRKPVVSPDGAKMYIPNDGTFVAPTGFTGASILVVDVATNTYTGEIPIGVSGASVNKLVITPDGSMIYAVATQSFPARIFAIDVASGTAAAPFNAPSSCKDILLNYTGTRLYVLSESRIVAYDTATQTEVARTDFNPNPRFNRLSLSLDGNTLYANHEFTMGITPLDAHTLLGRPTLGNTSEAVDSSITMVVPYGPPAATPI